MVVRKNNNPETYIMLLISQRMSTCHNSFNQRRLDTGYSQESDNTGENMSTVTLDVPVPPLPHLHVKVRGRVPWGRQISFIQLPWLLHGLQDATHWEMPCWERSPLESEATAVPSSLSPKGCFTVPFTLRDKVTRKYKLWCCSLNVKCTKILNQKKKNNAWKTSRTGSISDHRALSA